ncbi:sterol desaturase family protein [Crenothrix sp.]|uniref:sterol desaturase family protein n=1 Tax=Crenothrix sp. TaxID=3100433 RepID=UPI00374D976B
MENLIRLSAALGIFGIMICWEYLKPKRHTSISRKQRWPINLGLAAFNMLLMRFTVGSLAYLSAITAKQHSWGLLNQFSLSEWLAIFISWLALDFAIYGQHIALHKWPLLWRLHQIHHTDLEFDATTAVRFHPLEIVLSMVYKVICIIILGAHPLAVIAFEIILNGTATFNHSNIGFSEKTDKLLRWLIITPDMHRIHHSTLPAETNSNYGFSISCWDRMCKTYTAKSQHAQSTMPIGLNAFRKPTDLGFMRLLLLPFKPLRRD